ncbi:MAG: DUF4142 domain-containing protein [Myxococcales bacterium]
MSEQVVYAPVNSEVEPVETGLAPAVASPDPGAGGPAATPGVPDAVSAPMGEVAAAPAPETAGMGQVQALTDAQIVKVTEVVNSGEIEQAKLARSKSKYPSVKSFAATLVTQHTKAKQDEKSFVAKQRLVPEDSPTATDVGSKVQSTLEALKATDKADFDRLYVDAQVQQYQAALNLIDEHLLPSASDEQLKARLTQTRTLMEGHLSAAKELQSTLVASASGP